jgi:hypothetical protein
MLSYLNKRLKILLVYIKTFKQIPLGQNARTLNWQFQRAKINKHRPLDYILSDKYLVRDYIKIKLGSDYLIPLLGVYKMSNEINFQDFSYPIVIKNTHSSGNVIVARDINDITNEKLESLNNSLKENFFHLTSERQYKFIKPRIIVEKCLLDSNNKLPNDYKFHCFKGEVSFIYCSIDREGLNYRKIYNKIWEPLDVTWSKVNKEDQFNGPDIKSPNKLGEMISIAEYLSKRTNYCRIDLYVVNNVIYFGEYTHYHGGGLHAIKPEKYNRLWGAMYLD